MARVPDPLRRGARRHRGCPFFHSLSQGLNGAPHKIPDTTDDDGDSDDARTHRPLQAAACTNRVAFGPRAGQKVLTLHGAMPREADFKQALCADIDGFSLNAAVRCEADDRRALEQLCHYMGWVAGRGLRHGKQSGTSPVGLTPHPASAAGATLVARSPCR
jgi:hypothetical protein